MKSFIKGRIAVIGLIALMVLAACQNDSAEDNETQENTETSGSVDVTEIVGIEPGSGTMNIAQGAIDEYDLDLELTPSSEPAMLTALESAIANEEPVVVTLWQPHWIFTEYDLRFLEDPKGTLGDSENIHTMVREGLEESHPSAYQFLDNFYWEVEDMNKVMAEFGQDDNVEPREAAENWIEENSDTVNSWTENIEAVDNEPIELAYTNYETEIASTNVVSIVLEDLGYDVELTPLDMGVAFEALSDGEVDGMLIAWLPVGAASYYEEYQDVIVDLGPNLEGAEQGFVVPDYMDIESIDDLE